MLVVILLAKNDSEVYEPISFEDNVAYFGPEAGFIINPEIETNFQLTGIEVGTYTYTLQIVKVGEMEENIGEEVVLTIQVTEKVDIKIYADSNIVVYANQGQVNIVNNDNVTIKQAELVDISGRVMSRFGSFNTSKVIDVQNLADGIYIVRLLIEDNDIMTSKVYLNK